MVRTTHIDPFERTYPSGKKVMVGESTDGFERKIPFKEHILKQYEPISDEFAKNFIKDRFATTHPDAVNTGKITFLKPNGLWKEKPNRYDVYGLDAPEIPVYPKMPVGFGMPGQIIKVKSKYFVCDTDGLFKEVFPPKHKKFGQFKKPKPDLTLKQFKDEYKEIMERHKSLTSKDQADLNSLINKYPKLWDKYNKEVKSEKKPKTKTKAKSKAETSKYTELMKERKFNKLTQITHEIGAIKEILATKRKYLDDTQIQHLESLLERRKRSEKRLKEDLDNRGYYVRKNEVYGSIEDKNYKSFTNRLFNEREDLITLRRVQNERRKNSDLSMANRGRAEYLYQKYNKEIKELDAEIKQRQAYPKMVYLDKTQLAKMITDKKTIPKKVRDRMPKNLQNRYERMVAAETKKKEELAKKIAKETERKSTLKRKIAAAKKKLLANYDSFYDPIEVTDIKEDLVQDLGVDLRAVIMGNSRITALTTPDLFKGSGIDKSTPSKERKYWDINNLGENLYFAETLEPVLIDSKADNTYMLDFIDKPLKAMDKKTLKVYSNAKKTSPLVIRDKDFVFAVAPRTTEYDIDDIEDEDVLETSNIPAHWIPATPKNQERIKEINKKYKKAELVKQLPYKDEKFTLKNNLKKDLVYNQLLYELKPEVAKQKLALKD